MDMSLEKRFGSGRRPLLVGLAVLGCCLLAGLMHANASLAGTYEPPAGAPTKGENCIGSGTSNGKITGRGSTLQEVLQSVFAESYRDSVCGPTPETPAADESIEGNTMVAYDY